MKPPPPSYDKCVFLPHYGEFGFFITNHVRYVHYCKAAYKVVCCRRGDEPFFPSADEFFYEWENPCPDSKRCVFLGATPEWTARIRAEVARLKEELSQRFPGFELVWSPRLEKEHVLDPDFAFDVVPSRSRGLKTDVVISCRRRRIDPEKNFRRWNEIVAPLASRGLSIGIVGRRETSFSPPRCNLKSWTYGDTDADVEMLKNCRLYIGTDSGVSHMAAFLRVPMILFYYEYPHNMYREMVTMNENRVEVVHRGWNEPGLVVKEALAKLGCD
jgi:hypothetical protein